MDIFKASTFWFLSTIIRWIFVQARIEKEINYRLIHYSCRAYLILKILYVIFFLKKWVPQKRLWFQFESPLFQSSSWLLWGCLIYFAVSFHSCALSHWNVEKTALDLSKLWLLAVLFLEKWLNNTLGLALPLLAPDPALPLLLTNPSFTLQSQARNKKNLLCYLW